MNPLKMVVAWFRFLPIAIWVNWKDEKFLKDLNRWKRQQRIDTKDAHALAMLLNSTPEFCNLFIYRNRHRRIFRIWVAL